MTNFEKMKYLHRNAGRRPGAGTGGKKNGKKKPSAGAAGEKKGAADEE